MVIGDYKEIYADASPEKKLDLLMETAKFMAFDAYNAGASQIKKDHEYWLRDRNAMWERMIWLRDELKRSI